MALQSKKERSHEIIKDDKEDVIRSDQIREEWDTIPLHKVQLITSQLGGCKHLCTISLQSM